MYSWEPFCYDVVSGFSDIYTRCITFTQGVFVICCRYHVFLQLKKDILDGRLVPPLKSAAILASYAAQCE